MSAKGRGEVLAQARRRYQGRGKQGRSRLLDEICGLCGFEHKYASKLLSGRGTRDSLCPLDLLESVRTEMTAPTFLHVVEGGDHSLLVSKRHLVVAGETQEEVDRRILEAIEKFVAIAGDVTRSQPSQS